jgi:hypothetical protein
MYVHMYACMYANMKKDPECKTSIPCKTHRAYMLAWVCVCVYMHVLAWGCVLYVCTYMHVHIYINIHTIDSLCAYLCSKLSCAWSCASSARASCAQWYMYTNIHTIDTCTSTITRLTHFVHICVTKFHVHDPVPVIFKHVVHSESCRSPSYTWEQTAPLRNRKYHPEMRVCVCHYTWCVFQYM